MQTPGMGSATLLEKESEALCGLKLLGVEIAFSKVILDVDGALEPTSIRLTSSFGVQVCAWP
jgi:hypothetical protein